MKTVKKYVSWPERIRAAKKRGRFLQSDVRAAGSWNRCAIGENAGVQNVASGRLISEFIDQRDTPVNYWELGMDFYRAVQHNKILEAESIYKKLRALRKDLRKRLLPSIKTALKKWREKNKTA